MNSNFINLAKVFSQFIVVQLFVQILGFAAGILLIRNLTKQDYAYFVLANSFQGTINILADSGVGSAVSAIGGKVWQNPYRFGQLIETALQLRRYLGLLATLIIAPILIYMLIQNGASLIYSTILTIGILIELYFYLDLGVLGVVPRLYNQIARIQKLDFLYAALRIVILMVVSLIHLNTAIGIFASTIASGFKSLLLWRWVKDTVNINVSINQSDRKSIINIVKKDSPNCLFYCLQGQLLIWTISIFGNTENIAEVGALSRISVIYLLITSVLRNILLPKFSKCHRKKKLIKLYLEIFLFYLIVSFFVFVSITVFSQKILLILGTDYLNLKDELSLVAIQVIVSQILVFMSLLNSSKGWIQPSVFFITSTLIGQVILLSILDLSTVHGVLLLGIYTNIPALFLSIFVTYRGIKNYDENDPILASINT